MQFGEIMADEIDKRAAELQIEPLDGLRAARLAAARDLHLFRASNPESIHSNLAARHLVIVDPPRDEPPFFLPRALAIYSVADSSQAAAYFKHHNITLEALAVTALRDDLADLGEQIGAARITTLGTLQSPQLGDFHGGRPRIAEFVRWISDET
jgi:hypothetical protein